MRARPSGDSTPPSAAGSPGTPITWPLGIGRSSPRVQIAAVAVAAWLQPVAEPDGPRQVDRLRPSGQHRLRTQIDLGARDPTGHELAAEPVGRFQEGDPQPGGQEPVGGCESGDAAADDDDMTRTCVHAVC